jgi:hypothetical protein
VPLHRLLDATPMYALRPISAVIYDALADVDRLGVYPANRGLIRSISVPNPFHHRSGSMLSAAAISGPKSRWDYRRHIMPKARASGLYFVTTAQRAQVPAADAGMGPIANDAGFNTTMWRSLNMLSRQKHCPRGGSA